LSGEVLLSLTRLDKIREVDPVSNTMTVEAGVTLQRAREAASEVDRLYPQLLPSEGTCTIGGNLSTNAGGTQVVRYGNSRELCLGLEVVTAQGEVWEGLSGLRKDNTGYDLRDLFIGSEGTLGIITAATMKLYPQPAATLTAWAAVPSLEAAVRLLGMAHRRLGAGLTGFEVMGRFPLSLVAKHFAPLRVPLYEQTPFCVLLENADHESEAHARAQFEQMLAGALEDGCVTDAIVAESLAQAQQLWHIRENIPLAQAEEGPNIKHDISIAVSRIPEFCRETDALLARHIPGVRLVNFGHLGDGNLHYNVQAPEGGDAAAFLAQWEDKVNTLVYDSVLRFGGSISAEHGVGSMKLEKLLQNKSTVALQAMRSIKRALDPDNIMNPGRVIQP
jgi:FAD/FMN-containing dehydrogenase